MRLEYFLEQLETELYEFDFSESQCALISMIVSDLRSRLPRNIDETRVPILSSLTKNHIIYSQDKPLRTLYDQLDAELNRSISRVHTMQPTSLLCALYYLNDLIAASSAMGCGTEDSVWPNGRHINVMCRFLKSIDEPTEEANVVIQRCRSARVDAKAHVVPLILDIIEVAYARIGGWKVKNEFRKKQLNVDEFYERGAERCMAKGTLLILRWLQELPDDLLTILLGIPLDRKVMKELQDCSIEAIEIINEERGARRYRGGNSAATWLSLRGAVAIEPIRLAATPTSATSVAGLFSPIPPKQQSEVSESDGKALSL